MSQPEPPSFHLRLPQSLKDKLQAARDRNSLNTEIVERLRRSFEPDPALQLAEIFRPILETLSAHDQARLLDLTTSMVDVIVKGPGRKARRGK